MKNKEGIFATHPDLCKDIKSHVDRLKEEGATWKFIEENMGLQYPAARNISEAKTLSIFNQFRFKTSQIVKMQEYCKMNLDKMKKIDVDDMVEKVRKIQKEERKSSIDLAKPNELEIDQFGFEKANPPNKNMFQLFNLIREVYASKPDDVEIQITIKA